MAASKSAADAIGIASDHAGYGLKASLIGMLRERGLEVVDLGTDNSDSVDYPDFANALADAIAEAKVSCGILVCGTGIGIAMAANRHRHVRAAACHDTTEARLARQHNDANVLSLGARTIGPEVAQDCVRIFLDTKFEGDTNPRHARRVAKMS